jgi:hypothetical protein
MKIEPMEQVNFMGLIPAPVRYCKSLSPCARFLYAELAASANGGGYCSAPYYYFSEILRIDPEEIKKSIYALEAQGFVRVEETEDENRIYVDPFSVHYDVPEEE